jgi:hypothetical protein
MTGSRLARRLGLDRNPLRRRTDKVEVCLAAVLIATFLASAPILSMTVVGWVGRNAAAEQLATHLQQVPAIVQKAAPAPPAWELSGYSSVPARWTAPDGQARAGQILVSGRVPAGHIVRLWVNAAGTPAGPLPGGRAEIANEVAAALATIVAVGIVLLCLTCAGRWVLDRRRLAGWEAAWAAVGPQWTKRFRSRG